MVVIRLARGGAHKRPSYKVVVADSRKPRNGRFIEYIGYCKIEPGGKEPRSDINFERYSYWCSVGAKPSHAVKKLVRLKSRTGGEDKEVVLETSAKQEPKADDKKGEQPLETPVAPPSSSPPEVTAEEQPVAAKPETAMEVAPASGSAPTSAQEEQPSETPVAPPSASPPEVTAEEQPVAAKPETAMEVAPASGSAPASAQEEQPSERPRSSQPRRSRKRLRQAVRPAQEEQPCPSVRFSA